MSANDHHLIFSLDDQRYSIPIRFIDRVIPAIETTLVPKMPKNILGVITLYGNLLSVLNTRKFLDLKQRELRSTDQFVILRKEHHQYGLWVDSVIEVTDDMQSREVAIEEKDNLPPLIESLVRREDGIIFVLNMQSLFLAEETVILNT